MTVSDMAPRILKVAEVPRVLSIQSHTVCTGGAGVRGGAARGRSLPSPPASLLFVSAGCSVRWDPHSRAGSRQRR